MNQALSLSAMNMEDILSRQGSLLDLQKQLHDQEVESYKAEIIRLSRSDLVMPCYAGGALLPCVCVLTELL